MGDTQQHHTEQGIWSTLVWLSAMLAHSTGAGAWHTHRSHTQLCTGAQGSCPNTSLLSVLRGKCQLFWIFLFLKITTVRLGSGWQISDLRDVRLTLSFSDGYLSKVGFLWTVLRWVRTGRADQIQIQLSLMHGCRPAHSISGLQWSVFCYCIILPPSVLGTEISLPSMLPSDSSLLLSCCHFELVTCPAQSSCSLPSNSRASAFLVYLGSPSNLDCSSFFSQGEFSND